MTGTPTQAPTLSSVLAQTPQKQPKPASNRLVLSGLAMLIGSFVCCLGPVSSRAQEIQEPAARLFSTANHYIQIQDYNNAILVLNRLIESQPNNPVYLQDLSLAYYLNRNFVQAEKILGKVFDLHSDNIESYELAGDIQRAIQDPKNAQRWYSRGIRKYPNSGALYNDMGSLFYDQQKYSEALTYWTRGIDMDPAYTENYYHAARTFYYSKDQIWTLLYGEMYMDLVHTGKRAAEIRGMLLSAYKSLFQDPSTLSRLIQQAKSARPGTGNPDFRTAVLKTLENASSVVANGITPETLVMLRTRFILDWDHFYRLMYPYSLFAYQRHLLREGVFPAYNRWIFGPASNPEAYRIWVNNHPDAYASLMQVLNQQSLQPQARQSYQPARIIYQAEAGQP